MAPPAVCYLDRIMRGRRHLTAAILVLIPAIMAGWTITAVFAQSPSPSASGSAAALPGDPARGQQLFAAQGCASCHGANLEGGSIAPRLNPITKLAGVANPKDPAFIAATICNGRPHDPAYSGTMAAYCPALSTQQINDLTAFILDQNSKGEGSLDPVSLARSNVFWITITIFLLVMVTYLLARYNMRWIDRRAAERRERERRG